MPVVRPTWIESLFGLGPDFLAQLGDLVGIGQYVIEQIFEFVIAGGLVAQIRQLLTCFQQLAQRLNLIGHAFRREIFQTTEVQLYAQLGAIASQLVFYLLVLNANALHLSYHAHQLFRNLFQRYMLYLLVMKRMHLHYR